MRGAKIRDLENKINKLERCCDCGKQDGGCCYFEVTRSELEALVNEGSLLKGATYKITDRGDLGLWFEAISENELNPEGVRKMLVPAFYGQIVDDFGNSWRGIWHQDHAVVYGAVQINDLVVYNGLVWKNLTGNLGTEPNGDVVNWELVPKTSFTNTEYIPMVFGVIYDYENDWISLQWDDHNNFFGTAYHSDWLTYTMGVPDFNPVDYSDWNWSNNGQVEPGHFYNNRAVGIWNTIAIGEADDHAAIFGNHLTEGAMYNNIVSNWIHNNRIPGDIANNGRYILGVEPAPNQFISNIRYNINNGPIIGVVPLAPINVEYNTNNGSVGIGGPYAADVSDPIVTK